MKRSIEEKILLSSISGNQNVPQVVASSVRLLQLKIVLSGSDGRANIDLLKKVKTEYLVVSEAFRGRAVSNSCMHSG